MKSSLRVALPHVTWCTKGGRERYKFLPWERTKLDIAYASRKSLTLTEILGETLDPLYE